MQQLEQSDPLVHDEAVRVPACCLCVRHGTARHSTAQPLRETRVRGWRRREGGGGICNCNSTFVSHCALQTRLVINNRLASDEEGRKEWGKKESLGKRAKGPLERLFESPEARQRPIKEAQQRQRRFICFLLSLCRRRIFFVLNSAFNSQSIQLIINQHHTVRCIPWLKIALKKVINLVSMFNASLH